MTSGTPQPLTDTYDHLRRLAARHFSKEHGYRTLQPTALVHEVFLRLAHLPESTWADKQAILVIATKTMRDVLVQCARRRQSQKRGGRWRRFPLAPSVPATRRHDIELIEFHEALEQLHKEHERQGRVAEMQMFGGFSTDEIAAILDVSPRTVQLDWSFARAWLARSLR